MIFSDDPWTDPLPHKQLGWKTLQKVGKAALANLQSNNVFDDWGKKHVHVKWVSLFPPRACGEITVFGNYSYWYFQYIWTRSDIQNKDLQVGSYWYRVWRKFGNGLLGIK